MSDATVSPVLVGVDSSESRHDVYAATGVPGEVLRFHVSNDVAGLDVLLAKLEAHWPGRGRAFGFENPQSRFALALRACGERVYSTNPHAVQNLRKGLNPSGKKDDPADAHAIQVFLRENLDKLTPVRTSSETGALLQARVAERMELVRHKTQLLNQLTALLKLTYPVVLGLFSKLDQDLTLAFLARWPTPALLTQLPLAEFQAFLREHRYPQPKQAAALWKQLQAPQLAPNALLEQQHQGTRGRLLTRLQCVRSQVHEVEQEIKALFQEHPDQDIFSSLPGAGDILAPGLLATLGDDRTAWQSVAHLTAHCGTTPVTQQSGKKSSVHMRRHCDKDRRYILHQFANASRRKCPWAQEFYRKQMQQKKSHATALRNLATKWLRIIWKLWQDGSNYDPAELEKRRKQRSEPKGSRISPLTTT